MTKTIIMTTLKVIFLTLSMFFFFFFSAGLGSLTLSLIVFLTPLSGYICDRFGYRITNSVGAMLCITGLVTSSFAQSLPVMFLTHGLLMGLGMSFIYSSCFLVIAKYFKEKLSVATAIVALGGSFGVLFTGPLLQVLLDSYGWRGTYRIIVASFIVVCILGLTYNPNVQETTLVTSFNNDQDKEDKMSRISLYCSLWTFPTFVALVTSMLLTGFALYTPLIFLVSVFYYRRTRLQRQSVSLRLEIRWRNEEAINSTRNRIYSLNVFYLLLYQDRFFLLVSELI